MIDLDRFDQRRYEDVWSFGSNDDLQQAELRGKARDPAFPELLRDVWLTFFKYAPELGPAEPGRKQHRKALQALMETNEWTRLRENTKLDSEASAIAAAQVAEGLLDKMIHEEDEDAMRQAARVLLRQADADIQDLLDMAIDWGMESGQVGKTDIKAVRDGANKVRGSH